MPFATRDGAKLFWRAEGNPKGPPLLLLNSIGTDMRVWDRLVPLLAPRFSLLRMDMRGHGQSDAPAGDYYLSLLAADAFAVMNAAGVLSASVCGLSLGGMVAMTMAVDAPRRVEALVLACTSASMDPAAWDARIATVRAGGMTVITEMALERFFSESFRLDHPGFVNPIRENLLATKPQGYTGCAAAIRDMTLLPRLATIAAPTLVIAGTKDISTPFEGHGDAIAAAIPGARVAKLDAAHLTSLEAPEAMAEAIGSFLGEGKAVLANARDALFENGLKNRRQVLGDAWVDRSLAKRTPFTADFQAMITRIAWHEVWSRPGLDHRTRRLLVLAITASLGRWEEFRLHTRAGLEQNGFTEEELKETLMQIAVYAGVPAGNTAFSEAAEVLREIQEASGRKG